jgi:tRNA pseudouridine55 synthase
MDSIFAVWKPKGPTSHDMVDRVRRATGERRVGHAGTLDPLAEGVLVIATGKSTKLLNSIVNKEKEYIATIKLGEWSATDDAEGAKTTVDSQSQPTTADILKAIPAFVGEIDQVPPAYSAVKVAGKRAYKAARRGEVPELKPRRVLVKELKLMSYEWPYLKIKAVTGSGVYIRSLARDIGRTLGTGGYIAALERVRIGDFRKSDCIPITDLVK